MKWIKIIKKNLENTLCITIKSKRKKKQTSSIGIFTDQCQSCNQTGDTCNLAFFEHKGKLTSDYYCSHNEEYLAPRQTYLFCLFKI